MPQLLLAALLLVGFILFFKWLMQAKPATIATGVKRAGWIGAGVGLIGILGLVVTRNPGFLVGLLFFIAPLFVQYLRQWQMNKSLGKGWGSAGSDRGQTEVRARFFSMTLDHASGDMRGRVLEGSFAGRDLGDLSEQDLRALLAECAGDADSARLLEAYLDRRIGPQWRHGDGSSSQGQGNRGTRDTDMTVAEAWEVLGLAPGASEDDIRAAHRRLMQTVHPDRGGSDYLAARVNRAKDLLLRR